MSQQDSEKGSSEKKPKAIALLSGGLDSSLAVRMMLEQGVDVEAVAIKTPFCDFDCGKGCGHRVKEVADELGIKLKTVYFGEDYLRMLKNPKHGYGSGMNPCIDCRGMMYNAAKEHMERTGADFVITGEVLFQRPMSQNNRALNIIEKEAGMEGKVLRPLSAKHLPPTDAEKAGLIKRENLGDIKGRSRKGQLALAKHFGIAEPPNAAGGCLLTDPAFSKRVEDIMEHSADIPTLNDIELLKVGRHFRLTPDAKLVVGRNKDENEVIKALVVEGDAVIETKDHVGPTCILRGKHDDDLVARAAAIALRYSDAPKDVKSIVRIIIDNNEREISTMPADVAVTDSMRI
ncbi:MAG: tRNA (5-methylaminomethyl-2-thiouridylate)-methyltransferase [Nitrososphaera sp.]|jgi:tRNA U34 2-thiouridine synthase MnmA/TrmU